MKPEEINRLTERIIGCCVSVHRELGPGLLESVYEECLCLLLQEANMNVDRQGVIPVHFRGKMLEQTFKFDVLVENTVLIELKSVEQLTGLHQAQLLTYLKLSGLPIGLLCNFNVPTFTKSLRRLINPQYPENLHIMKK